MADTLELKNITQDVDMLSDEQIKAMSTPSTPSSDTEKKEDATPAGTGEGQNSGSETKEESQSNEEIPDEWAEKFKTQSSSFQLKLTEKHEERYQVEKQFVQADYSRFLKLAESDNESDVKIAKRLAKEHFNDNFDDLVKASRELRDADLEKSGETDKIIASKAAEMAKKMVQQERINFTTNSFIESHSIINTSSPDFNESVKKEFDEVLEALNAKSGSSEESVKINLERAYTIASSGIEAERIRAEAEKEANLKKIASAGNSSHSQQPSKPKPASIFAGIPESL